MKSLHILLTATMLSGILAVPPAFADDQQATSTAKTEAPAKPNSQLQAVHDNLVQAEHFLENKQYADARHALTEAKKGLGDYKWLIHEDSQKVHVKAMENEIGQLTEELKKEDPSTLDKAVTKVKGWATEVKQWLTSHPPKGHKPEHPKIFQHKNNAPTTEDRQHHEGGS